MENNSKMSNKKQVPDIDTSDDNEEIIKLDRKMGKLQGLKNKITDI